MFFSDLARCISQDNVSFDYYSMPSESNVSNICPLPTPGQLERLITIRSTIITNDDQLACQLAFVAHKTCHVKESKIMTLTMSIPSILIEGVVQAFVAALGIVGNIACIVILFRLDQKINVYWEYLVAL